MDVARLEERVQSLAFLEKAADLTQALPESLRAAQGLGSLILAMFGKGEFGPRKSWSLFGDPRLRRII